MIENVTNLDENTFDAYIDMQFKKNPALNLYKAVYMVAGIFLILDSIIGLFTCFLGKLDIITFLFVFMCFIGYAFLLKGITYRKTIKKTLMNKDELGRENHYKFTDENIFVHSNGIDTKIEWNIINLWFVYNNCLYFMAGSNNKMFAVMAGGFTNGSANELVNLFKNKAGNPLPDDIKLNNEAIKKSCKKAKLTLILFLIVFGFMLIYILSNFIKLLNI